ncbi:hypothetical protein L598_000100000870 [Mesorhizobium sp. J18]|nr:hypothetical protein L598_000100000870 [Mesorhizobium sp. J18]
MLRNYCADDTHSPTPPNPTTCVSLAGPRDRLFFAAARSVISFIEDAEAGIAIGTDRPARFQALGDVEIDRAPGRALRTCLDTEIDIVLDITAGTDGGIAFLVGYDV